MSYFEEGALHLVSFSEEILENPILSALLLPRRRGLVG